MMNAENESQEQGISVHGTCRIEGGHYVATYEIGEVCEGPVCDKCGLPVPLENDAVVFDSLRFGSPLMLLFYKPRHLLPLFARNGFRYCEGSPSRAQLLEGQEPDNRGYEIDPDDIWPARAAYAEMQRRAAAKSTLVD